MFHRASGLLCADLLVGFIYGLEAALRVSKFPKGRNTGANLD